MSSLQSVRGMNDLLPERIDAWHTVEDAIRTVVAQYGYREIRTPMAERTELFKRGIGEQTDIVEKEMYTWEDRGGESLTLRPEATASCVRAGIQHGLFHNQTQRLYYVGPMFRRERPQKGRYRQFHQFGVEAFGWHSADVDAEVILLARRLWQAIGLEGLSLDINTLGSEDSRRTYREALVAYLREHQDSLDEDSLRRLEGNPLRVLDSKNPQMADLIGGAPNMLEYLDDEARAHFDAVCGFLDDAGATYNISPRLVRGLDYYTSTVFEWTTDQLGAQSAVCGGGRYDGLVESLGGKSVPGAGFAIGLERLVELVEMTQKQAPAQGPQVFIASLDPAAHRWSSHIGEILRDAGLNVMSGHGPASIKARLRQADRSGADFAVIVGPEEVAAGEVTLKPLRKNEQQVRIPVDQLAADLALRLQSDSDFRD